MAVSKCPSCTSHSFEIKEATNIIGAKFKYYFIQCAVCGAVVGVQEYFNTGALLEIIAKKLGFNLHS